MQALYFIRSYYELKEEHDSILNESSAPSDGQPRGTGIGDPTAQRAMKAEALYNDICIIERNLRLVPDKHREVIWKNVMEQIPFKEMGDKTERQYAYWKGVFIRHVAEEKKII